MDILVVMKRPNLLAILQNTYKWEDIHNRLVNYEKTLDKRTLGGLLESFCEYYYRAEPTVSNDYQNVWRFENVPEEIKTKLNLGKRDGGVDVLLQGYDGSFSAVQCKFKSNQDNILSWSKDKIANLFGEGNKADFCIVFTNASGVDRHTSKKEKLKGLFAIIIYICLTHEHI